MLFSHDVVLKANSYFMIPSILRPEQTWRLVADNISDRIFLLKAQFGFAEHLGDA